MYIKLFSLIALLLYSTNSVANLSNYQRIRLARAKLALSQGNLKEFKKLIGKNINTRSPHIESIKTWGDYLVSKQKYREGLKAYYLIIKKLHTNKLLNEKNFKKLQLLIKQVSKPENYILETYYRIGSVYDSLLSVNTELPYKKSIEDKILKYYWISKYYKHEEFYTTYRIGKYYHKNGKVDEGLKLLKRALTLNSTRDDHNLIMDDINLILAKSLLDYNRRDASTLYFKSLHQNNKTNNSTKEYAQFFLDSLEKDFFNTSALFLLKQKFNIHELKNIELENSDSQSFKEEYGAKDGLMQQYGINMLFNKKFKSTWSFLGQFNFFNEQASQKKMKRADNRYLLIGLDLKKLKPNNTIYKLSYNFNALWERTAKNNSLQNRDGSHDLIATYGYNKAKGQLKWNLLYSVIMEDSQNKSSLGFGIDYQRHNRSLYWNPTYHFSLKQQSEINGDGSSIVYDFALSNTYQINEKWLLYSTFDLIKQSNSNASKDYLVLAFQNSFQKKLNWLENLYWDIDTLYKSKSFSESTSVTVMEMGTGLSYNF